MWGAYLRECRLGYVASCEGRAASPLEASFVVELLGRQGALGAYIHHNLSRAPPLARLPNSLLEGAEGGGEGRGAPRCGRCLRLPEEVSAAKEVLAVARSVGGQSGEGRGVKHCRGARGTVIFDGAGAVPHAPPAHAVRRLPSRRVATASASAVISHELVVGGIASPPCASATAGFAATATAAASHHEVCVEEQCLRHACGVAQQYACRVCCRAHSPVCGVAMLTRPSTLAHMRMHMHMHMHMNMTCI